MASSSAIPADVDAGAPVAQGVEPADVSAGAQVSSGEPPGSVDSGQQPLPDIFNREWQKEGMPDTEFNRKYPPDPWGEEASPNARVWKVYRDQQELSHNGMLAGWNKTLDVLLIFAGLFSAVLTAFLIESYKSLQPDYTQYVATFLYAATLSHNRTGSAFPTLDTIVAPDLFVQTSAAQRWTNGLWFSSLVISLAVALLCILIKQWLDAYDSHISSADASPNYWARRHSLYHRGLERWGVPGLISFLPLLLHMSLFLFFVGLILFLRPLDDAISNSLLVMISCVGAFYFFSLVLPAWRMECPSYTPLLAQALLVVSRGICGPLYVVKALKSRILVMRWKVRDALFDLARRAEQSLETIQLRSRQQVARETLAMSNCDHELDGYVLSSLIHLPTDTNRDIVFTAIAAIGAVTSTRTINALSRKVSRDVLERKMGDFLRDIPSTDTGFAITSHAQLYRADAAMPKHLRGGSFSLWYPTVAPEFRSSLGIDGLLMQASDIISLDNWRSDVDFLIRQLQTLPITRDRSPGFPLRFTCLIYMERFLGFQQNHPAFLTCFLLVFCAGRFATAARHELVRALQSVQTVLRMHCAISLITLEGGELADVWAALNGLWTVLADFRQYQIDTLTAQILARETFACYLRVIRRDGRVPWVHLSGLSTFVRSSAFGLCVGTGHSLADYIYVFPESTVIDSTKVPIKDYWDCNAILLKLGWDHVPRAAAILSNAQYLFPVGYYWRPTRLSQGSPYATQDDWYEPALSAILTGQSAIATWIGADSAHHDYVSELAKLAHRISIVLCRRKRLGRDSTAFVPGFFSGSLLLMLFRARASQPRRASGLPGVLEPFDRWEDAVDDLAKHCLKLSADGLMAVCAQLEEAGDAGSELRAQYVAFAQWIRNSSTPGGELSRECAADCPCMTDGQRRPRSRGSIRNYFVERFRRRDTAVMAAEHV